MRLLPWKRKTVKPDRAGTLRERAAAEARLAHAREHVIVPLGELRAVNHIQDDIGRLIRRRVRRETGGDGT